VSDLTSPIIHIDDVGRVAALVAPFDVCIRDATDASGGTCWTAPRSPTRYHWAQTKVHPVTREPFAWIGWGMNHATERHSLSEAMDHYANTSAAVMAVQYHELSDGIYAFGSVAPKLDEIDIDLLRCLALSGDWRRWAPTGGRKMWDMLGSQVVLNEAFRREDAVRRYVARTASADSVTIDLDTTTDELVLDGRLKDRLEHIMRTASTTKSTYATNATNATTLGRIEYQGTTFVPEGQAAASPPFRTEHPECVRTAAMSAKKKAKKNMMSLPGEVVMALDTVTGDGRVILASGLLDSPDVVPVTIDHAGTIGSVIGSATGFAVADGTGTADISIDLDTEFGQLAADSYAHGVGYSVELDSTTVEWWPARYAITQGVDIAATPLDEELMVCTAWRLRAVSVVATPAFVEAAPESGMSVTPMPTEAELALRLAVEALEAPIEALEIPA
jgi:hypothetical protein